MFETPAQFLTKCQEVYSKKMASARFGNAPPQWLSVECAYDFKEFIEDFRNPDFGGHGHSTQLQVDTVTGEVLMGRRGSEVHFMHFYNFEGGCNRTHSVTQYT